MFKTSFILGLVITSTIVAQKWFNRQNNVSNLLGRNEALWSKTRDEGNSWMEVNVKGIVDRNKIVFINYDQETACTGVVAASCLLKLGGCINKTKQNKYKLE